MFAVKGLDHIVLRTADAARLIAFYRDVLGCAVERSREDLGLWHLRAGAALIDIVDAAGPLGRPGGAAPGPEGRNLDHLCLRLQPFDEAAVRAHLAAHGIDAPAAVPRFGAEGDGPSVYIADPDGNTVELKGPPFGGQGTRFVKRFLGGILLSVATVLILLAAAEVVLRFLPVREVVLTRPVAADARPFDISAPPNSTVAYSQSFGLKNARRRRTNNMGFFADFDFEPGAPVDLAIGDSYVEALQVEFAETFHQIWSRQSGRPVYPLGVSGAPLSQYEAYLDQACREFKVRRAVITIVANDFNESFHALRARDGFFHYRVVDGLGTEGGHLQATLQPTPFETTPLRALANSSSLVRYLFFNLEAGNLVRHLTRPGRGEVTRRVEPDQRAFTIGRQAIDLFLSRIGGYCLGPRELLLVIDGDRRRLYGGRPNRYLGAMREHFLARAGAAGFRVLDLEPVFAADYAAHGQMFNDPHEWHWNTHGHAVIAAAIAKAFAP